MFSESESDADACMQDTQLEAEMVDALLEEVERWERDQKERAAKGVTADRHGRTRLPVVAG